MTALAAKRAVRTFVWRTIELAGKVEQVYQGGRAAFDTSTGLVAKIFPSSTLVPIGTYVEDQLTASGQTVLLIMDRERAATWLDNSTIDPVTALQIGSLVYAQDDVTAAKTSASGTRSVAGRAWKLDTRKGVLVESL